MYHRLPVLFITCLMVAAAASKDSALAHLGKANQLFNEERFRKLPANFKKLSTTIPGCLRLAVIWRCVNLNCGSTNRHGNGFPNY